jgi:hypothetical protein
MLLAKLPGPEREQFLMQLTDLVSTEDPIGAGDQGLPQNNLSALDRNRRSGQRSGARDNTRNRVLVLFSVQTGRLAVWNLDPSVVAVLDLERLADLLASPLLHSAGLELGAVARALMVLECQAVLVYRCRAWSSPG